MSTYRCPPHPCYDGCVPSSVDVFVYDSLYGV